MKWMTVVKNFIANNKVLLKLTFLIFYNNRNLTTLWHTTYLQKEEKTGFNNVDEWNY